MLRRMTRSFTAFSRPVDPSTVSIWLLGLTVLLVSCRASPPPVALDTKNTSEMLAQCAALITERVPFAGETLLVESLAPYRFDESARAQRIRLAAALLRG